jgi:hydrogenase maturation factor
MGVTMQMGKVSEPILKRSVLRQIKQRRDEVLQRPGVGVDCTAVGIGEDEGMLLTSNPITVSKDLLPSAAIHSAVADIRAAGGDIIGVMLTILLPEDSQESQLQNIMKEAENTARAYNLEIIGGHTEITSYVNRPVITVTGVGKIRRSRVTASAGVLPGDEIVMTKWAGLLGTAILAKEHTEELLTRYNRDFIQNAEDFTALLSIAAEADIGEEAGVKLMHNPSRGGIFAALWEIGVRTGLGLTADLRKIPIKQETIEICEFFDLNPYQLYAAGSLLLVTGKGNELAEKLNDSGIPAVVIGRFTDGNARTIRNQDEERFLEPPKTDELYQVNAVK